MTRLGGKAMQGGGDGDSSISLFNELLSSNALPSPSPLLSLSVVLESRGRPGDGGGVSSEQKGLQRLRMCSRHWRSTSPESGHNVEHMLGRKSQSSRTRRLESSKIELNNCYVSSILEWFQSLENLTHVCANVEVLKNKDLQLLSKLPSLLYLSLSPKHMATEKLLVNSNGLPVVREFHLHSARLNMTFEPRAMRGLEKLVLLPHALPEPEETSGFLGTIDQLRCLRNIYFRISSNGAADVFPLFQAMEAAIRKSCRKTSKLSCN